MPRDTLDEALAWPRRMWGRLRAIEWPRRWPLVAAAEGRGLGLSGKLLLLTIVFVMLAEVLIFVPSVANFRITWLTDRITAAQLAALAAEGAPGGVVPDALRAELLRTAQVRAVAVKRSNERRLVLPADMPTEVDATFDFRAAARQPGVWNGLTLRMRLIWEALSVFWAPEGRVIRVIGEPRTSSGDFIEVVLPEAPLRTAMVRYGLNVMGLSVIISVITAALVYFALNGLFVQPMMRMARNMLSFSQNPADASRIILPSQRQDEIGTAERELAHMQGELTQTLQQKNRLAALGLAVSKISHDLRNMLASAQLLSDRLSSLAEPAAQQFAPKLIASLDRAIALCDSTLKFGRAEEAPPRRELFALQTLIKDVGDELEPAPRGRHRLDHRDREQLQGGRRPRPAVPRLEQPVPQRAAGAGAAGPGQGPHPGHSDARRTDRHHRRERRWSGRAGEGARPPLPGLSGLGPQGRNRPGACRRARAGNGPWRRHPPARHREGRVVRDHHFRSGYVS